MSEPVKPAEAPAEDLPPADPAAVAAEPTPLADEVSNGSSHEEEEEDTPAGGEAPATAKSFQVDIGRALQRETHDGKGDEDPGESDWNGYATDGVEVEEASS